MSLALAAKNAFRSMCSSPSNGMTISPICERWATKVVPCCAFSHLRAIAAAATVLLVVARGVPVGLGEPLYDKLDADIAHAMMGINAVKGVEIGAGFKAVEQRGTTHGDELTPAGFLTNNAGGVLGGISTGQDITVSLAIKPTSSIRSPRRSIDREGKPTVVETHGRHDPCVGIRAAPIAEALLALVVMDHVLLHRAQCGDVRVAAPPIPARAP